MADYSNIKRIIIRKPTSLQNWCEAFEKLNNAKYRLDIVQRAAMQGLIPQTILSYQMGEVDQLIYDAARLSGFANPDDMKYFIENFQNL